jgi:hypothetical protein
MRKISCCLLLLLFWSALGGTVASSTGCATGACIRNSDCADGLRCDRAECVVETSPAADASVPDGSVAGAAATVDDAGTVDSGASDGALDSGSQTPDAN